MIRILLLCSLGISSLSFQKELDTQARKAGIPLCIDSASVESAAVVKQKYEMVLLAPQVRFNQKKVSGFFEDITVIAIDPDSFAAADTSRILSELKKL